MLERDKNHPCIFSWSVGNESWSGKNLYEMSMYFRKRDDSRPVHYENASILMPWETPAEICGSTWNYLTNIRSTAEDFYGITLTKHCTRQDQTARNIWPTEAILEIVRPIIIPEGMV